MPAVFVASTEDHCARSDIPDGLNLAEDFGDQVLHVIWPSTQTGDLVVWVLSYTAIAGAIVNGARYSLDGITWTEFLIDSILWTKGARAYYEDEIGLSGPDRNEYLFGGLFIIEDDDDLDTETDIFLGFDVAVDGIGAFEANVAVATYRDWTLADFSWEVFTVDGDGDMVPAVYPATDGNLVCRAIAYLADTNGTRETWQAPEVGGETGGMEALLPINTWDVREHTEFEPLVPNASALVGMDEVFCLLPACDIQDKEDVEDSGQEWQGNSGVIMQVRLAEVATPDPQPTFRIGRAGNFRVPYPKWAYKGGAEGGPDGEQAAKWQLNQNYAALERICREGTAGKCQLILTRNPSATWQEQNWYEIERWAKTYVTELGCLCQGEETPPTASVCLLRVPHKRWSTTTRDPRHETENWQAVEQWASRLQTAPCECEEEPPPEE